MQSEVLVLGIFAIGQTFVAIFWAGIHQERARANSESIKTLQDENKSLKEKSGTWHDAIHSEVKAQLQAWQEVRGEKIEKIESDLEKVGNKIEKGFGEIKDMVSAVASDMTNQHHRIRVIERHMNIQPSEPRLAPIGDPRRER